MQVEQSEARVQTEVERLAKARYEGNTGIKILCRPHMAYKDVTELVGVASETLSDAEKKQVEILVKYDAYIKRSSKELESRKAYEAMSLEHIDYTTITSLSSEGLEVLQKQKPITLGAASRMRGVRDSDVTALLVHLRARTVKQQAA